MKRKDVEDGTVEIAIKGFQAAMKSEREGRARESIGRDLRFDRSINSDSDELNL